MWRYRQRHIISTTSAPQPPQPPHQAQQAQQGRFALLFFCVISVEPQREAPWLNATAQAQRCGDVTKRRRDRRLRMHWRHEQLTLQMVMATVQHPSYGAPRGQMTATRTRTEEREMFLCPQTPQARSSSRWTTRACGTKVAGVPWCQVAGRQGGRRGVYW